MEHEPMHNAPHEAPNMKERLLAKVREGSVTMRPRAYFFLQTAAVAAVALLTLIVSVFILNFILFSIRVGAPEPRVDAPFDDIIRFLKFFPWPLLACDIVLIGFLEWLLRKFRFGYRRPLLYLLLGTVALVFAAALFVDRVTGWNDELLRRAEEQRLPQPVGNFYRHARYPWPEPLPEPSSGPDEDVY